MSLKWFIFITVSYTHLQKQLIENAIKQNKLSNLVCGTVHAFQGDEKDVVLFSTAISERTSSVSYTHLDVYKRQEYKTYQAFLEAVEKELYTGRLNEQEKITLEYLSKTILSLSLIHI